ncbi:MAG: SDR family NAD(P)-dependent oxidoreductase [Sphingomonadales bacterium]
MTAQTDFSGRHAVVTGGATGIGAAIADRLAAAGARVTVMGRTWERLRDKAGSLPGAQAIVADVTDEASVRQAFDSARENFGPVSILINNAGAAPSTAFTKTTLEFWRSALDVNLTGVFLCSRAAVPDMIEAGSGRIVNIASIAGLQGFAYVTAYCAAKHGAVGLTRAMAMEFATRGITVNAVCPGFTETDIVTKAIDGIVAKTGRTPEQTRAELTKHNPQGRLIEVDEVASLTLWLCSHDARSVTGQALAIAGGEVM